MSLEKIQKLLEMRFSNIELLEIALTHSSYVHEKKLSVACSNERLEFLGDAVLNLCIAELLIKRFPEESEGKLSKRRASLVNQKSLADLAKRLNLGDLLRFGKGEEKTGGRTKESVLADAYEALLGALYLDKGLQQASERVQSDFSQLLEAATSEDFKTKLQETVQKYLQRSPRYVLLTESGPDHEKVFEVHIEILGHVLGKGRGRSKRLAEQEAAREALSKISETLMKEIKGSSKLGRTSSPVKGKSAL